MSSTRHAMIRLDGVAKTLHPAPARRRRAAGAARRDLRRARRRMRRARRALRRRQVLDPQDDLRQLPRRRRQHPGARRRATGSTSRAPRRGACCALRRRTHRLCQPVPARHPARRARSTSSPSRARERRRAGRGAARAPRELLDRLNLPERLWQLPPATFSGGEQQRVNIARGFAAEHPILLLDEPTASLDAANRAVVVELIRERKRAGAALLGIFHDDDVRAAVADRSHRRDPTFAA